MKTYLIAGALTLVLFGVSDSLNAQNRLLQKAKEKLKQKGNETIDGLFEKDRGGSNGNDSGTNYPSNETNTSNNGSGDRGQRKMTPPDVEKNIDEAQSSFSSRDYSGTRFAIQQAIIGIEYELGEKILDAMPDDLGGLPMISENDNIYSSGVGFVGLSISREYDDENRWAQAQIVNNTAMLSGYNMMLSNAAYTSSDDVKVTRIGDYRAVMEYESNGMKVAIPFGQSSLFLLELNEIYEESEAERIAALFDINKFKQILGEQ